jgi:pimeloyl-ACP methyl ester carboxylesterase
MIVSLTLVGQWLVCGCVVLAQETFIVELRNGLRLGPGTVEPTETVSTNILQRPTAGQVASRPIDVLNDGLRRTYYNASPRNVINSQAMAIDRSTTINFPAANEVNKSGAVQSFLGIDQISGFNINGRRTLHFRMADNERMTVLQQITELTPQYAKLEILRGADQRFAWDCREALTSIPSDELNKILENTLDLTRSSEWLRLYSFYLEAQRFRDAKRTIQQAIERFPTELGNRVNLIAQTEQLLANQQFEEINLRREAGQTKLAYALLNAFPRELIETQLKIKGELDQLSQNLEVIGRLTDLLKQRVAKLPEPDQQLIAAVVDEILGQINLDSAVRLDDFMRLAADPALADDSAVALALGGWLLGPGSGVQNFAVAKSLIQVRQLTRDYLNTPSAHERATILSQLRSQEGAQPELLARILAVMRPSHELPEHRPEEPEGFYRQSVLLSGGGSVEYTVQLPPEYDPNRKYPCIMALPGSIREYQANLPIDYWCGNVAQLQESVARFGPATRMGYIVICPRWMLDTQAGYQYTEAEHARVLACYRDALRRTSVNTDRVFISGHFEGATAAWDIAQSHPDLWAGAVFISPTADKYIPLYHSNVQAAKESPTDIPLATYIVYGEMDGVRLNNPGLGVTADRYLKSLQYDCVVVEHIGQGRGLFSAELPRIMQWMQLAGRQRLRSPRALDFVTMRSGDRFFYWLEAAQLTPEVMTNAFELDPARDAARRGKFEAMLLDQALNGVRISKIPSVDRSALLWLTPQMVDFSREITVVFRGKTIKYNLTPDIEVMLEDVRRRGDRLGVFWQKLELGAGN